MHTTSSDAETALMLIAALAVFIYRWKILFYLGIGMVLLLLVAGFTKPNG